MRTTLRIDDDVFRAYKRRAAQRGTTFAAEVGAALRAGLAREPKPGAAEPLDFPVGGGTPLPVDVNDNAALLAYLEGDDEAV